MPAVIVKENLTKKISHSRYRFVMGGLILFANLLIGVMWNAISPLLPLVMEDYQITAATASLLISLPVLVKASVGLPGGVIISRLGLRRILTVCWFLMGGLILCAVAPNFISLLLIRLVYGVGIGIMMPAIGTLVMQWFPSEERTTINTANLIIMSLGSSLTFAVAAPLTEYMSWQYVLGLFGAFGLVGAFAWTILGRTKKEKGAEQKISFTRKDILAVLTNKTIFLLFVGDSLVFGLYAALTNWLPTYYYEFRGMTLSQAGNMTGLLPFVGIFAVLIGGIFTNRIKNKRLFFVIPGILVGLGGFGSFLFSNPIGIIASVVILGFGTWVYQPILLSLPMELPWMTPLKIAIVWGASMTFAGFVMFLEPIIVGVSRDMFGTFIPGFVVAVIPALFLILTGIYLPQVKTGETTPAV